MFESLLNMIADVYRPSENTDQYGDIDAALTVPFAASVKCTIQLPRLRVNADDPGYGDRLSGAMIGFFQFTTDVRMDDVVHITSSGDQFDTWWHVVSSSPMRGKVCECVLHPYNGKKP